MATLSADGLVITGRATFDGDGHDFVWQRARAATSEAGPAKLPDVTLTPPKGGAIPLAVDAETLGRYSRAVASGNARAAASMVERRLVIQLTEPVGVTVEHRGDRTTSVRPVDGPHAGKKWAAASADALLPAPLQGLDAKPAGH